MNILQKISYFIYPPSCYSCNIELQTYGLCSKCYLKLSFGYNKCVVCNTYLQDNSNLCSSCKIKSKDFDNIYFACFYQDLIKKLIYQYKFNGQTDLSRFFAKLIYYYTDIKNKSLDDSVLIPVPLHRYRLFTRGYNQSVLLGNEIKKLLKCDLRDNILLKKRNTKQQVGLNKNQRRKNLKNSFEVKNSHLIKNKHIILIDDVITTGTTITECAKILSTVKVKSIDIIAIAKVTGRLKI